LTASLVHALQLKGILIAEYKETENFQ